MARGEIHQFSMWLQTKYIANHSVLGVISVSYTLQNSYIWLCSKYLVLQEVMHNENHRIIMCVTQTYSTVLNMVAVFALSITGLTRNIENLATRVLCSEQSSHCTRQNDGEQFESKVTVLVVLRFG